MRTAIVAALAALAFPVVALADDGRTPSPAGAKVFIIEPKDGATVSSPVSLKFGIEGMEVAPAGTDKPNTGHHHLIIDSAITDFSSALPKDETHIHYGKGQTEASIELKPGKHTLQLILGDKNHIPHDPPVKSDVIAITVD
jgi:hypothetical protein